MPFDAMDCFLLNQGDGLTINIKNKTHKERTGNLGAGFRDVD
jgi:hypothetical protein